MPCWGKEGGGDVGWGQKREGKEEAGVEATSLAPLAPRPGDQYRLRNLCSNMMSVMTRRSKMSSAISTTDSTDEPNHRLHWLPRLDRRLTICGRKKYPCPYQAAPFASGAHLGLVVPPCLAGAVSDCHHQWKKNGHETPETVTEKVSRAFFQLSATLVLPLPLSPTQFPSPILSPYPEPLSLFLVLCLQGTNPSGPSR